MLIQLSHFAKAGLKFFFLGKQTKEAGIFFLLLLVFNLSHHRLFAQSGSAGMKPETRELFRAIRSGSTDHLTKLLSQGVSANDSLNGYSALMAASLSGTVSQMKILIDHGADVNYTGRDGITALWLAVPDWEKTNLLLSHGADANHTVRGYNLLVKTAAMPGTVKVLNLLMEKGADPAKSGPDNFLIYNAASSGDTAILGLFIRKGASVNDTIFSGDYPINGAIFYRCGAAVKMLVDNGARVNVLTRAHELESFNGFTPLMYAALNNDKVSFYYLLEHGADPNLRNANGYTALMLLQQADVDDPAMTKALLDHGAEPAVKTPGGNDALHFAMQKGNTASVEILKKYATK